MTSYKHLLFKKEKEIGTLWLNRSEKRNAFNIEMIHEITDFFSSLQEETDLRALIIRAKGPVFCAGADINWMKNVGPDAYDKNLKESRDMSFCFQAIYSCPIPTIAIAHGAVMGGGNGILAACDVAVAHEDTMFSLSEVRIGVVPACISTFVLKRIGEFNAKYLMLTGKRFSGKQAKNEYSLVQYAGNYDDMEKFVDDFLASIRRGGPHAERVCKKMLNLLGNQWSHPEALEETAMLTADIRQSVEAQEGMTAFLEKRKPSWYN
ncbi:MAG: enoyl-CoA hydratase-related protein [Bacteroidales bacterium]